ncbi:unnamed protein product [Mycena citricolor]|uniref:Uncharacterized protein n=1 Tax=Mycena citricolor TaxID=2018698 RepID=A0AAD2K0M5_9AGAR|nr:unnamed protein product [Mycena citricolor]
MKYVPCTLFDRATMLRRHLLSTASRIRHRRSLLTLSAVEGPLDPPLVTATLPAYFTSDILRKYSDRPGLICRNEAPRAHGGPSSHNMGRAAHLAWSFDEFDRHINALARGLLRMGVRRGDRVGVIMGNTSAYAMLQWACASIGAILATINPAYRAQELGDVLNLVGVQHLIIVPRIRKSSYAQMLVDKFPQLTSSAAGCALEVESLPALRNLVIVDNSGQFIDEAKKLGLRSWIDWREVLVWDPASREARAQRQLIDSLDKDDVINLQFTSGTTGAPKAVSLTHSNLLNNAISIGSCMHLTEQDVATSLLSSTALMSVKCNLAAWTHGSCIVYPAEVFHAPSIVDTVIEEQCTALHGVPTHFLGVLSEVERRQADGEDVEIPSLRTGIAAGSPIPIELMKKLIAKMNLVDLTNAYGMTETSPVSFQTTSGDALDKRVETVGKVQPHVRAKLVDPDGRVVPVGAPGELCVAGYLLQKGYWRDDERTKEVMKTDEEGTLWMHTGDEAIMDEEGYLRIQIENAILTNHGVEEAAVVAVPDEKYGEVVGAWIVRARGTSTSREEIKETVVKSINPQNAPAWIFFVGEDGAESELPKTASGKVQKHVLREWSKELDSRDAAAGTQRFTAAGGGRDERPTGSSHREEKGDAVGRERAGDPEQYRDVPDDVPAAGAVDFAVVVVMERRP